MAKKIIFNLSGYKSATTWLSSVFAKNNCSSYRYFAPIISKHYPLPDFELSEKTGFVKLYPNPLENLGSSSLLTPEDKIFLLNYRKHNFFGAQYSPVSSILSKTFQLLEPYTQKSLYLGDPNNHKIISKFFRFMYKSDSSINHFEHFLEFFDKRGFHVEFMMLYRPMSDQMKSYIKMYLGDKDAVTCNSSQGKNALFMHQKLEDQWRLIKNAFTPFLWKINPLLSIYKLAEKTPINLRIRVFSYNDLRQDSRAFLDSINQRYLIMKDGRDLENPPIPNISMQYPVEFSRSIDKFVDAIINDEINWSQELREVLGFEKLLNKGFAQSKTKDGLMV